ncbi:TAXI family TRAP transporter solute-binding subunit [Actinoallomurus purpureus]|uniref:TAXI family TRAP transporter solute-binding subunit n=1 Tax=Actinoallomurus purpureus TaxID=478114 RepID=UPI002093544E|nr:TAXI family TRAP transporter solute-binding subunit [Actinoallomurus purpureus]MCO6008612.1 TAXI family TRAP transporter solute-binding subunit [Actinoallomurus purpureus]
MPNRRTVLLAGLGPAALAGLGAVGGCALTGAGDGYRKGPLPIAAGLGDGVYYLYGQRLARLIGDGLPGVRVSVDVTTGSVDNLRRLRSGRDRLAFVAADAAATTVPGSSVPIRALARLYDDYVHLVVSGSSGFRSIGDLRGRRVSVGAKGSGVELVARRVLTDAGLAGRGDIQEFQMGLNDSAATLRTGLIDAFFWSGGLPTTGIAALAEQLPLRLIPLGGLAPAIRRRYGPYYRAATIPGGTYVNVEETQTFALANFLVAPASLDDGLAYRVTEILIRDRDAIAAAVPSAELLDVRDAVQTDPVPLHPGAVRYYRSIKL